jgi:hypothetical protein
MRQGRREKISVTIDPGLHDAIDRHARLARVPKSKVTMRAAPAICSVP